MRELLVVFLETPYGAPHDEHSWFWPVALKCDRGRAETQPPRGCCRATSGTSCGRNLGVIDQILNEWCDPFVSAARLNEWFTTNFGAADELTADYRTRRRRAADSGGAGRTATGIGREKGVERLLLGRGPYLATPTSARNAPSDTPGDRARARHCVSGLFCVRDDLAEIAAIKGRG